MDWGSLISDAANGDTKQRLAVLPALQDYVENNSLSRDEVADLMRVSEALIKDHNFKICQGTLQVLHAAIIQDGEAFKPHANVFIPPTVEKLGDPKPTVREAAQRVLLVVSEILPVGVVLEKIAWGWGHKNHRVREELANTMTLLFQSAGFGSISAAEERQLLTSIISVMEDPTASVREAALGFMGEMYCQTGNHLAELLKQFDIRPAQQREIDACFAEINPIQNTVNRANALPKSQSEKSLTDKSEKGSRPASGRPSNLTKRGGFGDAGGLTAGGELPATEPVPVSSENDFKQKCSKLVVELDVKKDWDARIRAMLQLEGMVLGGASRLGNFLDELRNLKDALTEQLNDRRSAVSRVACHLLGELAVTLGNKFEPLAVHFLPYMMKVSVISVQVMADAAVDGMETIVRHCRARGAVVPILNAIISERNKVMRTHCSKVFLLMLEVWERKAYEKNLDLIEKSMAAAVQDAQADVRTNGRLCYGAYAQACPDRVADYLKRLQPALREKLLQAGAEYVRQNDPSPASVGSAGGDKSAPSSARPISAPVRRESDIGMKPPSARSTVAGGALRITTAEEPHEEIPNRRLSSARAGPTRVPAHHGRPSAPPGYGRPSRVSEVGPRRVFERDAHHDDTDSASYNGSSAISQGSNGHALSLSGVLKKIRTAKGATDWERKRDGFNDMREWISDHGHTAGHELSRLMDKLVPTVMDNTKDAHHQVVVSALEAWAEMAKHGSKPMEPYLERLLSCAFLRAVDAKAVIRNSAQGAMMAVAASFPADVLLVAITKCLAGTKSAKGKVAVMEYSAASVGAGTAAGPPSQGAALSSWVESCAKELSDRSPDVRKVAGAALEHVYKSIDSVTVLAYITATPSSEAAGIKRALARGVPDLPSELAAFQRNGGVSLLGSVSEAERNRKVSRAACSAPHSPNSPSGKSAYGPTSPSAPPSNLPTLQQQNRNVAEAPSDVRGRETINPTHGVSVPPMPVCSGSVDAHTTSSAREAAPIHISHREDSYAPSAILNEPSNKENIGNGNRLDVCVSSAPASPPVQPSPAVKLLQQQQQQMYASPQHHMPASSTYAANAYVGTPCSTPGSEAPMDPAVAEARLRMLVGRLNTQEGPSPDTLIGIQDMARGACEPAWQACFSQVLLGLMHIINNPNEHIQEFAVEALREMTSSQTDLFLPQLDLVLPVLLNLSQSARQVSLSADEAMEQLVKRTNPERCMDILALRLPTAETHGSGTAAEGMVLQAAIRNVGRAVGCLRAAELMQRMPGLLPGLFESFRNLSADVRKAVVFCLVDIYLVVGDQLMPLLSPLSTSQLKLVTIYVNRAAQRLDRPPPMAQVA